MAKKGAIAKKGSIAKKGAINKIICFHSKTVLLVLKTFHSSIEIFFPNH